MNRHISNWTSLDVLPSKVLNTFVSPLPSFTSNFSIVDSIRLAVDPNFCCNNIHNQSISALVITHAHIWCITMTAVISWCSCCRFLFIDWAYHTAQCHLWWHPIFSPWVSDVRHQPPFLQLSQPAVPTSSWQSVADLIVPIHNIWSSHICGLRTISSASDCKEEQSIRQTETTRTATYRWWY